jgi:hypothetical protein
MSYSSPQEVLHVDIVYIVEGQQLRGELRPVIKAKKEELVEL